MADVTIPTPIDRLPAYVARPAGDGPWPVALRIDHDVKVHADAGHSFMNDHRDEHTPWVFAMMGRLTGGVGFVEPAARDARGRIAAFFERHLRDGS